MRMVGGTTSTEESKTESASDANDACQKESEYKANSNDFPIPYFEQEIHVGTWMYECVNPSIRGWVHKHYWTGMSGPYDSYTVTDERKCVKCGDHLPDQVFMLAQLQRLRGRI
jgi:hypothetical protein